MRKRSGRRKRGGGVREREDEVDRVLNVGKWEAGREAEEQAQQREGRGDARESAQWW
jgi:hypothetical protein